METFSETFSSKIVGTLPLPASGTKLYAVHIAFVGGGGGYIMQLKSPKWTRSQKSERESFHHNNQHVHHDLSSFMAQRAHP